MSIRLGSIGVITALAWTTGTVWAQASLPVDDGELVATSFPGYANGCCGGPPAVDNFVVTLADVRNPAGNGAVLGANWNPPLFHNLGAGFTQEWVARNLGMVFGIELDGDANPNLYVSATSNLYGDFSAYPHPQGGLGPDGPAAIYRIGGTTGNINSFVVTGAGGIGTNRIPTSGPGIGQIAYDDVHDQWFATNFEDGRIYRIDNTGIIVATYDPFAAVGATPTAYMALGERVFAVAVFQGRLYFSVWLRDNGRPSTSWPASAGPSPTNPNNSVWSLGINPATGALVGPEQLEINVPYIHPTLAPYSNPVSDITFSVSGEMMLAERTMPGDFGQIDNGHRARLLEYSFTGSWTPTGQDHFLGNLIDPNTNETENCAGGAGYTCEGHIWSGADTIGPGGSGGYGLQWVQAGGNTMPTRATNSYHVPWPTGLKTGMGDVDVRRVCEPCEVVCPAGTPQEGEPCGSDTNHGCDFDPVLFGIIQCPGQICGTSWADGGSRDTDWYEFDAFDTDGDGLVEIQAKLNSEFPGVVRIHDSSCTQIAIAESIDCEDGVASICVQAGSYFVSVKPETIAGGPVTSGYPCGAGVHDYVLDLQCIEPCPQPPQPLFCCYVPRVKTYCAGANSVIVKVRVCNKDVVAHQFNVTASAASAADCNGNIAGPTGFTYLDPQNPIIPPNGCVDVRIQIARPAGMTANNDCACYAVDIVNLTNGQTARCVGKLCDRRRWCAVPTPSDDIVVWQTLTPRRLSFQLTNIARPISVFNGVIVARDATGAPAGNVSLDGLPPGEPVVRTVKLPPESSGPIEVEAQLSDHEPFVFYDIILMADFDGDGVAEAEMAVHGLTSTDCGGDFDGSGDVGFTDLVQVLAAWDTENLTLDLDGNGVVGFGDLVQVLSRWGPC